MEAKNSKQEVAKEPSPDLFWETVNAHQRTAALQAAVDLELFTAIGEGANTPNALAIRCQASERGIRILCDYLTVVGFLHKENGRYALTPDSAAFLDKRSPAYMGGILPFLNSRDLFSGFENLAEVVRRGTTLLSGAGVLDPEDPIWVEFARSMTPLVAGPAEFIADLLDSIVKGPIRLLDIAAGHGLFGTAVARHNAEAEIVFQDWKNVLHVARENARKAGIPEERCRFLPGDAFKVDFGDGYDVVLVTNLYHHFDLPTCQLLAQKIHAALKPGGCTVTLEFVPNEDRVTPPIAATFSLMMLGVTPAGDAYTFQEYDEIFRAAGFQKNDLIPVPRSPQHLIVSYR